MLNHANEDRLINPALRRIFEARAKDVNDAHILYRQRMYENYEKLIPKLSAKLTAERDEGERRARLMIHEGYKELMKNPFVFRPIQEQGLTTYPQHNAEIERRADEAQRDLAALTLEKMSSGGRIPAADLMARERRDTVHELQFHLELDEEESTKMGDDNTQQPNAKEDVAVPEFHMHFPDGNEAVVLDSSSSLEQWSNAIEASLKKIEECKLKHFGILDAPKPVEMVLPTYIDGLERSPRVGIVGSTPYVCESQEVTRPGIIGRPGVMMCPPYAGRVSSPKAIMLPKPMFGKILPRVTKDRQMLTTSNGYCFAHNKIDECGKN
jgi:hypothetical protein